LASGDISAERVIRGAKPLCFDRGRLLIGRGDRLALLDLDSFAETPVCTLPAGFWRKLLNLSALCYRALRSGVGSAVCYADGYFVNHGRKLYRVDPQTGSWVCEFTFSRGKGPLSITAIDGIAGFEDGLYFGEYFANPSKESAGIYHRDRSGTWRMVYTFPPGSINHVHALVPDRYRQCVWVLTGDFGDSAAIWQAGNMFTDMQRTVAGSQQYRACVAFPVEDGLLYATDSQFDRNHIRLLRPSNGSWASQAVEPINGSCIYGCRVGSQFVFSTSTEPGDSDQSVIARVLETRKGPGILRNESQILTGTPADGFRIIARNAKDPFPYRLFQFGTITFPAGENPGDLLFSYSIGNRTNDLSAEVRKIS
jgi:hypothetical protein